ncbi:hypothetical protein KXJ69_09195 [Aureisphaera sp. CAU 1614]|uniref:Cardiolipin synthetase n=1 Tax=Halomarinibacterium sedimenti TaxID=2857106 RepID=A0A9X1FPR7_9FLAO|nr:hypothetical protein [Halomarinibacterium sedimenti]MBW2938280.1 hypothetical protein [Halomarinibacterium sedimenti]
MKNIVMLLLIFILSSCSSTKLVNQWKSQDTPVYEANKILVVGMSSDIEVRRSFEEELSKSLESKGVVAVRSIDFFENVFQVEEKTEKEMDLIENSLLEAGFDSVIFSKLIGAEEKVTLMQASKNFDRDFLNFKEYYIENQSVYTTRETNSYKIYHTETSVFCICAGKERELLWKGNIDLVAPEKRSKSIKQYVKVLLNALEENEIVLVD